MVKKYFSYTYSMGRVRPAETDMLPNGAGSMSSNSLAGGVGCKGRLSCTCHSPTRPREWAQLGPPSSLVRGVGDTDRAEEARVSNPKLVDTNLHRYRKKYR